MTASPPRIRSRALAAPALALLWLALASPASRAEPIERPARESPYRASTAIYYDQLAFINPLFLSGYRGAGGEALARFDGEVVSEFDLYMFLALARHPRPHLYELYKKAKTPAEREPLRRELVDALRAYAAVHRLALAAEGELAPIEAAEAEIVALTGYMMAWTEARLEPRALVSSRDALREYRADPFEHYRPSEARVRVILRRFRAPEPPDPDALARMGLEERFDAVTAYQLALTDERESNAAFLEQLRDSIAEGRLDFADAARRFSDGPSKADGGLLPPARPGDLAPQIEAEIFVRGGGPNRLSSVVRLPEAAALLLVESVRPEGAVPFEEALPEAREAARLKAVKFLYDRELEAVSPWKVLADAQALEKMPWDYPVVAGPGFRLSKAQMLGIYPFLENHETFSLNAAQANFMAKDIGAGVYVRDLCRRAGLGAHPFVLRGNELAETLARARRGVALRVEGLMMPTDEEAAAYEMDRPELFQPVKRYQPIVFSVPYPEGVSKERGREMARELLEDFERRARAVIASKEAEAAKSFAQAQGNAQADAAGSSLGAVRLLSGEYNFFREKRRNVIVNLARDYQFPDIEMFAAEPDFAFETELGPYGPIVRDMKPGEFSKVETLQGEAALIYLVDEEEILPEEAGQLRVYAANELALRNKVRSLSILLNDLDDSLELFI